MKVWKGILAAAAAALLAAPPVDANNNEEERSAPKGGTITGTVKIEGRAPRRRKIRMTADPKCAAMHATPPMADNIVVDRATKGVKWAFVWVSKGLEGKSFDKPAAASIDQKGCSYEPHVLGVMVGQDIVIKNSDDLLHNIHALPFDNKEFNFGQPQKGMTETKAFTVVEKAIKVKCDVHPWMGAWVHVLPHPFHATTDDKGKFEIKGVPAGKYTVTVWHELYKDVTFDVEVTDGGTATKEVSLSDRKG